MNEEQQSLERDIALAVNRAAIKKARLTVLIGEDHLDGEESLVIQIRAAYQTYIALFQREHNGN